RDLRVLLRRVVLNGLGLGRGTGHLGRRGERRVLPRRHADGRVNLLLDRLRERGVLAQVRLPVVAALAEPLLTVREERAGLLDDVVLEPEVEDAALGRDALAVLDVELRLAERRRHLVLHDLHPDPVADRLDAVLERLDAADVEPLRRVELERATARLGLRRSKHYAHLLAD